MAERITAYNVADMYIAGRIGECQDELFLLNMCVSMCVIIMQMYPKHYP